MKERPILFKAEMVNAILSGNKTQTRRIIKDQPHFIEGNVSVIGGIHTSIDILRDKNKTSKFIIDNCKCPYGKVGDQLWVRETFHTNHSNELLTYRADFNYNPFNENECGEDCSMVGEKWKPSIFMNRKYSRIQLEITDIRVERLNDISQRDARAEGVEPLRGSCWKNYTHPDDMIAQYFHAKKSFESLWESINGKDSWDLNPWVWVVEFKAINT